MMAMKSLSISSLLVRDCIESTRLVGSLLGILEVPIILARPHEHGLRHNFGYCASPVAPPAWSLRDVSKQQPHFTASIMLTTDENNEPH